MSDWAMTYCLTGGRVGDICDHPQRAAGQRADRNIDIKYTLKPLCPTQWRAMQCLIDRGFSGGAVLSVSLICYATVSLNQGPLPSLLLLLQEYFITWARKYSLFVRYWRVFLDLQIFLFPVPCVCWMMSPDHKEI